MAARHEDSDAVARLELAQPGPGGADDDDEGEATAKGRAVRTPPRYLNIIEAPAIVSIRLICPTCDEPVMVEARLQARVTRDNDGTGAIALRTRAAKVSHLCDAETLGLAEGPRDR